MKIPMSLALAAASFLLLGITTQSAQAQQAEYVQQAQNQLQGQMQGQMQGQVPYQGQQPQFQQAYPVMDQNQYAAQQWAMQQAWIQKQGQYQPQQQQQAAPVETPKVAKPQAPTDYELQEQAIQKGLSENAGSNQKQQTFNEGTNTNWSTNTNESYPGNPSKIRGAAKLAGRMLGRTAQVALPTVGAVLLTRAMNRNTMGMNRTGMGMNRSGMGTAMGMGNGYNNGYGSGYGNGYNNGYGNMGYNNMAVNPFFGR